LYAAVVTPFGKLRRHIVRVSVKNHPVRSIQQAGLAAIALALSFSAITAADKATKPPVIPGSAALWNDPTDIEKRDLYYGIGGKEHEPHGPYTFDKEDMDGSNPKFSVTAADGTKWKVKLGQEARPETASARLVWAAGYYTNEDYFLADMQIANMPERLHRGQKLIGPNGTVHNVRLKRQSKEEKKEENWSWKESPFENTREWNGLRVMMALINNWDLKDENNAVYKDKDSGKDIYMVSDLGASFGSDGRSWPEDRAKDNLDSYTESAFLVHARTDTVDFGTPARPRFVYLVGPKEYIARVHLEYIGKNVPREDARWMGQILSRLSPDQLRDAFRASGYAPNEVDGFVQVLRERIDALTSL
jgi:hypothetical protein